MNPKPTPFSDQATVSLRDAVIAGASDPEFFDGLVEVVDGNLRLPQ